MKVATIIQIAILIMILLYNLFIIGVALFKINKEKAIWYYSIALGMSIIISTLSLSAIFLTDYPTNITYAVISLIWIALSGFHCGFISEIKKDK